MSIFDDLAEDGKELEKALASYDIDVGGWEESNNVGSKDMYYDYDFMVVTIIGSFTVEVQDYYDGGKCIIRDPYNKIVYKSDIPEDMTVEDFAFKVFFNVKQASKKGRRAAPVINVGSKGRYIKEDINKYIYGAPKQNCKHPEQEARYVIKDVYDALQRFHFSREETLPLADIINEIDDIWAENKSYKGDYASVVSKCYDYADELDLDYPEETEALRYAAGLLE